MRKDRKNTFLGTDGKLIFWLSLCSLLEFICEINPLTEKMPEYLFYYMLNWSYNSKVHKKEEICKMCLRNITKDKIRI
jgi:hypothetical protein